jgi:serine/threonine protein kinase
MISVTWIRQQFPQLSNVAHLAGGGQKIVFSATHPNDGDVVIKIIVATPASLERLQREILAVQKIASSRVPKMKEVGALQSPIGPVIWLREERISGESVRDIVKRGPLSKDEVIRLGLHVLEALTEAERARIVHRDVKPDNIMRDANGNFWLLDFGIARHLDLVSATATAALVGPATIGYAPPEQYRNKKREIDARADLFALGVTMVECLTGKHDFRDGARDPSEVIRRIESTPLSVPAIANDKNNEVGDLLRAMVQRRLDCRPASAADALSWLTNAIS